MVFAHCHRKNMNQRTPTSVLRKIIFCISLLSIHIIHVHSFQFQTNRNRNRNRGISSIRTSTRTIRMAHNHNLNKRASPTKHTSNPYAYREIRVPSRSLFSSSTYSHSSDGHASGRGVEFTRLNQSSNPDNVNGNNNSNGNSNVNVNVNSLGKRRRASRTISKLFSSLPGPLNFSKSSDTETEFDATTATATKISLLEQENEILRQTVSELERENDFLGKNVNVNARKSIIMEQFEGEGQPMVDSSGQQIDPTWWENNNVHANANANVGSGDVESQSFNLGLTNRAFVDDRSRGSSSISTNDSSFSAAARNNTTISFASSSSAMAIPVPPPPLEECNVDVLADGSCPLEPDISFKDALKDRAKWLVGLLALQSMSGFILARNELLLQTHPVIVYFLTMLVGAGGNAGNQAAVRGELSETRVLFCFVLSCFFVLIGLFEVLGLHYRFAPMK